MFSAVLLLAMTGGAEAPAGYHCSPCYSYCSPCYSHCTPCYSYCTPCYSYCTPCYSYCCTPCYTTCCYPIHCCTPVICTTPGKIIDKKPDDKKGKGKGGEDEEVSVNKAATLVVSLPADAKLLISGAATTSTSDLRTFVSPDLKPGVTYSYDLAASVLRNGKTVTMTQKVSVRAGEETRVTLTPATQAVASR